MIPVLILHGPNLNLLGEREPGVYGQVSFPEINQRLIDLGKLMDFDVRSLQSNHEGQLIDILQDARLWAKGVSF